MRKLWLAVLLAVGAVAAEPKTPGEKILADRDKEMSAFVVKVIEVAKKTGTIRRIDYAATNVVVGPAFYELEFDGKQDLARYLAINIILKRNEPDVLVYFLDSMTNKKVATFSGGTWRLEME